MNDSESNYSAMSDRELKIQLSKVQIHVPATGFLTDVQAAICIREEIHRRERAAAAVEALAGMKLSPQEMRIVARDMLGRAQVADGLRPFLVIHDHRFGASHYIAWAKNNPTEQEAQSILDSEFEPHRDEYLNINLLDDLGELAGSNTSRQIHPIVEEDDAMADEAPSP